MDGGTCDFPLPPSTPFTSTYPCERGTQHARNNFVPRKFARVPSASESATVLRRILRQHWGFGAFRGPQEAICEHALKGCDILVVAPTGLGKSVCFQVPAIAVEYGITIVVSPLKSLMQDQVTGLRARGVVALQLNENTTLAEHQEIKRQLGMGHPQLKLLYVTPESLLNQAYAPHFAKAYAQKQIARIVVDEAHVLHEWGGGFRPKYQKIADFVRMYPGIPKTALTASATADVRHEITKLLCMPRTAEKGLAQWVMPFNRKNLFYDIRYLGGMSHWNIQKETETQIVELLRKLKPEAARTNAQHGVDAPCVSGIVYCRTVASCDMVASRLSDSGIPAMSYYAKQSEATKTRALEDWKAGKIECIVATIAFGMGIDHPHVRYVIHFDMPKSFEGYYQETGRAGRDGHRSRCVMFYSREDGPKARFQACNQGTERTKAQMLNSFKSLQEYAEDVDTCRHIGICRFFGEDIDTEDPETLASYCDGMCDVCSNRTGVLRRVANLTEEYPTASPIVPVPPLQVSSSPETEPSNCTFAVMHDQTQPTQRHWVSFLSPAVGSSSANGIEEDTLGNEAGALRPEPVACGQEDAIDPLGALFDDPGSDPGDFSSTNAAHPHVPLFDLPSSHMPSSQPDVVDLTLLPSSQSSEEVLVKDEVIPLSILEERVPSPLPPSSVLRERVPAPLPPPRRGYPSILRALDVNLGLSPQPRGEPSRLQTIDQLADEGVSGAVVIGEPRSPGHAKRKQKERERTFKDVRPATEKDGPYSFYNSGPPRKRGRTENLKFTTPAPARYHYESQGSPLLDLTSGRGQQLRDMTPLRSPTASHALEPVTDRKSGLARIQAALKVTFESGDRAEEILAAWGKKEKGDQRLRLIKKVARDLEADVAQQTRHTGDYAPTLVSLADSLKMARNERGVRLITSGKVKELTDERARRFLAVEQCFRSCK